MTDIISFFYMAWKAYRLANSNGTSYVGRMHPSGACNLAIFVGTGREAWRISVRAIEESGSQIQ